MEIELIQSTPNPEEVITRAARNDYGGDATAPYEELMDSIDGETIEDKKHTLLSHLITREHYGPLEHVHASFSIKGVSRVTMAQATRHRLLSWDVQSQRYCDFSDADYNVPPSFNDPNHFSRDDGQVEVTEEEQKNLKKQFEDNIEWSIEEYEDMVERGIPKEDARYILPTAMEVDMVMSGNLRALLHVVNMRSKADVQHETREFANGVAEEIEAWVPNVYDIIEDRMPLPLGL